MNKEEKKAIERMKQVLAKNVHTFTNELEIVLNLVEKLQKENEELRIIKLAIQILQTNYIEDEKYIVMSKKQFLDGSYKHLLDDYISIQKVKDKIEDLYKEDRKWTEKLSEPDSNFKNIDRNLKRIKNQIESLQELIEEKGKE